MMNSLPIKLSVAICSILLVFFLAGMSLLGYIWYTDFSDVLNNHGVTTAKEVAANLDKVFVQAEQVAQTLADNLENLPIDREILCSLIESGVRAMSEKCPSLIGICVAYCEGMLVPDEKYNSFLGFVQDEKFRLEHYSTEQFDYFYKDWFLIPRTLLQPVWTLPFRPEIVDRKLLFSYAVPFYKKVGEERQLAGVVVVDLDVDSLDQYLGKLPLPRHESVAASSQTFVMNQFGHIILFPEREDAEQNKTIFTICDEAKKPNPRDRESARSLFRSQPFGKISFQTAPLLNEPSELFYATCLNHWVVGIAIPSNWTQQILFPVFRSFIIGWSFVLAIIIAVIFLICKRLNRPLLALTYAAEQIGRGDFTSELPGSRSQDEIGRLTFSFQQMRQELIEYVERLKQTVAARERAETEISVAKKIQEDILPKRLPPFEHCEQYSGAAHLTPAKGVGGDLYDVFLLDEDHLALIVGDVSGKGVPAALFMAVTQTLHRSLSQSIKQVDLLVGRMNEMLYAHNNAGMFVTYWAGFLNIKTGLLTYTNAGHNPPIWRKSGGQIVELKDRHGLPLGVFDIHDYGKSELQMEPGDQMILYTDGVTEAFSKEGEVFGEPRLLEVVKNSTATQPIQMRDEIGFAVAQFAKDAPQSDDITLLLLQRAKESGK